MRKKKGRMISVGLAIFVVLITIGFLYYLLSHRFGADLSLNGIENLSGSTYSNEETISVYGNYDGDNNNNSEAIVIYKITGDSEWTRGMDMSRPTGLKQLAGFIFVEKGQSYDIAIVFDDPDGMPENNTVELKASSRVINPVSNGNKYYVSESGSDSNSGAEAAPFKTITYAVSKIQAGDTIYIMNGTYRERVSIGAAQSGTENNWITITNYPNHNPVIDGSFDTTDPSGDQGIWQEADSVNYPGIYKTTIMNSVPFRPHCFLDDRLLFQFENIDRLKEGTFLLAGEEKSVAGGFGATGDQWSGWALSSSEFIDLGDPIEIFVKTPDGSPPDGYGHTVKVTRPSDTAFSLNGASYISVSGLTFKYYGTAISVSSSYATVRNLSFSENEFFNNAVSIYTSGSEEIYDITINDNKVELYGIYDFVSNSRTISWDANKSAETNGFMVRITRGLIVRNNYIEGPFNGIGIIGTWPPSYKIVNDVDIFQNTVYDCLDDGIENEGSDQTNVRIWENRVGSGPNNNSARVGVALAPVLRGPTYVVRNKIIDTWGTAIKLGSAKISSVDPDSLGVVLFYHNTIRSGISWATAVYCTNPPRYDNNHFRNNIFYSLGTVISNADCDNGSSTYDFDQFNDAIHDIYNSNIRITYETFEDLQASDTGYEDHGLLGYPSFTNSTDYITSASNAGHDKGQLIYGINDCDSKWPYYGAGPDIGANEVSEGNVCVSSGFTEETDPEEDNSVGPTGSEEGDGTASGVIAENDGVGTNSSVYRPASVPPKYSLKRSTLSRSAPSTSRQNEKDIPQLERTRDSVGNVENNVSGNPDTIQESTYQDINVLEPVNYIPLAIAIFAAIGTFFAILFTCRAPRT